MRCADAMVGHDVDAAVERTNPHFTVLSVVGVSGDGMPPVATPTGGGPTAGARSRSGMRICPTKREPKKMARCRTTPMLPRAPIRRVKEVAELGRIANTSVWWAIHRPSGPGP